MVSKFNKQRPVRRFRLEGHLIDRRFRRHWRNYIIQCGLAALALLIVLLVVDVVLQAAIVVAIAATAFIVFVAPHSMASTPRRVIGGHVVALIVGTAFSLLYLMPGFGEHIVGSHFAADVIAVFSVGLSILLMVLTNTEHPPAAGTALGLVIGGWAPSAVLFVLLGALILSAVHRLLRPHLTNLL